jgi:hypothetical protein
MPVGILLLFILLIFYFMHGTFQSPVAKTPTSLTRRVTAAAWLSVAKQLQRDFQVVCLCAQI